MPRGVLGDCGAAVRKQDSDGSALDPGIAKTVRRLREWGSSWNYETTDSGDGRSKFEAGTADETTLREPHVFIHADAKYMVDAANDLLATLRDGRLIDSALKRVRVEATYWPADGTAMLQVFGLDDSMWLPRPTTAPASDEPPIGRT